MSEAKPIDERTATSSDGAQQALRPVVFIGLGGAASLVLRRLRRRFAERGGEASVVPPLRFLALDTDAATLRSSDDAGPSLSAEETLHLPLRKPAEYRAASDEILSWLSRRWLYNIPRSLGTEGLRPLGRLAFVDHRLAIAERLRRALADVSPRVFIVASIDGGAGGGMLLDVAYAVRQQLDELQLSADGLCGLLLHATFARGPANDLRKANAYATLTELNHFMQGNAAYRTGPLEVLPAGDVSEPPFHDAYLVDLGQELSRAEFDDALGQVAEYLYLNATSCAAALDEVRRTSRAARTATAGAVTLRSFGLHAVRIDKLALAAREADRLCLSLAQRWLGENTDGAGCGSSIQPPDFTLDDLVGRLQAIAEKAVGGSAETHFRSLVAIPAGLSGLRTTDPAGPFAEHLRRIHALFGMPAVAEAAQPERLTRLEAAVRDGSQRLAVAMGDLLVESIETLVEQPHGRLPAALAGANLFQSHFRDLRQAAGDVLRQQQAESTSLWSKLQRGELPGGRSWLRRASSLNDDAERCLLEYCRLRMRAMVYKYVVAWLQDVAAKIAALSERLTRFRQALRRLSDESAAALGEQDAQESEALTYLPERALRRFADPAYLLEFENSPVRSLLADKGGLLALAEDDPQRQCELRRQVHELARAAALGALRGTDAGTVLLERHPTAPELAGWVSLALSKAVPRLAADQDRGRLFVVLPQGPSSEKIAAAACEQKSDASLVVSCEGDVVLLREVEGILLSDAAAALVASCDDCAAAARRVLTRVDVSWTMLPTELLT